MSVSDARAQSYICDRPAGWAATTGDDCLTHNNCYQHKRDGVVWRRDELVGRQYHIIVGSQNISIDRAPLLPGDASTGYSRRLALVSRNENSAIAVEARESSITLFQFFFEAQTLHWIDSYLPAAQAVSPARLSAFVSTCRRN
jgi:hypothetical protein